MRNIIVTGGSRGLGLGIARHLAKAGFCVHAIARKESAELAAAIQGSAGSLGRVQFTAFDLSDIENLSQLVKMLRKAHGPIYGLVNNAGISHEGLLAMMHTSQIEQLIRLNTLSPVVLTKYVTRTMMADAGGGRIVNVASIVASTGYSGLSAYAATKASMVGFTKSLAREMGHLGVTVNAVAPGFVDTDLTKDLKEEQRQQIMRRSALKRLAEIQDVASAVGYLLSDEARNITGTVMTVDAGSTA